MACSPTQHRLYTPSGKAPNLQNSISALSRYSATRRSSLAAWIHEIDSARPASGDKQRHTKRGPAKLFQSLPHQAHHITAAAPSGSSQSAGGTPHKSAVAHAGPSPRIRCTLPYDRTGRVTQTLAPPNTRHTVRHPRAAAAPQPACLGRTSTRHLPHPTLPVHSSPLGCLAPSFLAKGYAVVGR